MPRPPAPPEASSWYALYEFALVTVLLFGVVSAVRLLVVPSSALAVSGLHLALAAVGAVVGALALLLIRSPWGRRSGAHMNPAVSVGLWLMGAFPGRCVLPYVGAQAAGSLAGTALAALMWGAPASDPPADYAVVQPAPGWGTPAVAATEIGCLFLLTLVIGFFLANPTYDAWLPAVLAMLTAAIIAILGPRSGGSTNPARQIGPAVLSGNHHDLAVYLLAPVVGAVLGAAVHRELVRRTRLRRPRTYRLCPASAEAVGGA
ncbi:aquaporin [Streptomyces sp. SS7]|uniref:MIP/aquaporin family protein n=1 Tax=Streptomyces sp. SS7 TaxID=3108485 RepID=UPI0030EDFC35